MQPENRAVLMTGRGAAAIAVVRLTGPGLERFLTRYFSKPVVARRCVYGELRAGDEVIDDPVAVMGEGFVDLNIHGGPWVIERTLELARGEGFQVTETYEPDAELCEGETIIEREIEAYLPLARTELAMRVLLAQGEAWKRFSPSPGTPGEGSGEGVSPEDRSLYWLLHPPRIAIVGVPNAGKSTLANALFAQERSIVSEIPGTTRDYVSEYANIDGLAVELMDTPGIRESADRIEQQAIGMSRNEIQSADLILGLLDVTRPIEEQMPIFSGLSIGFFVANKADQPAKWNLNDAVVISAATGVGMDDLRAKIKEHFGIDDLDLSRPRWWTKRQRDLCSTSNVPSSGEDYA